MKELSGKVAVVTGAGSGIGRAIAAELAAQGCVLALVDIDADAVGLVADRLRLTGASTAPYEADVSDEASIRALVAAVTADQDQVNILVNNAGVVALGRFEDAPLEDFACVTGVNAWGVIYGTKHFLPHMPSGDAHVVNVISAAGIYAEPGRSAYSFTKFGVRGFTEALRLELAEREVGVTAVYPGIIDTNIAAATPHAASSSEPQAAPPVKPHPPEGVAKKAVAAIRTNKARVLVGRETYLLDIGSRLMPTLFPRIVQRITKV